MEPFPELWYADTTKYDEKWSEFSHKNYNWELPIRDSKMKSTDFLVPPKNNQCSFFFVYARACFMAMSQYTTYTNNIHKTNVQNSTMKGIIKPLQSH